MDGYKKRAGSYTLFGYVKQPENVLRRGLSERLGISPEIMDFRTAGRFFFYTSYGDVAKSERALALKLGFLRSPTKSPLSCRELLDQKIITPHRIDDGAMRGNALVACFSRVGPEFVAFKNLLSQPQLYYWASGDELIASDNLRPLIDILDRVELNQDVVPFHFVFRHAPGPLTYFKDVHRLLPGQTLKWKDGKLNTCQVQDLRFSDDGAAFDRVDCDSVAALCQELKDVMRAYVGEIERSGYGLGNLLSGGVDSSILQLIINEQIGSARPRSFSFVPANEMCYAGEVRYAKEAVELLKTDHTFVDFMPQDYPDLVVKTIQTLGQPMITHMEPCKLHIASFLAEHASDLRFFFTGLAADALFGLDVAKKIKGLDFLRRLPASGPALAAGGKLLGPFTRKSETLSKAGTILSNWDDPHLFVAPANAANACTHFDIVCRAFGPQRVRDVLEYRRGLEEQYLGSQNYTERVQIILLLTYFYEIQAQSGQLFLAHGKEQVYPFLDDDILRISFAFCPEVRYIKGLRVKAALKDVLEGCGLSSIARRPKLATHFDDALGVWIRSGPLREMIQLIDRPGFLSKGDFAGLIQTPNHFVWDLLKFDVFQKQVLA